MCSLCITSITNINASSLAGYGGFLVFGDEGPGVLVEVGRYGGPRVTKTTSVFDLRVFANIGSIHGRSVRRRILRRRVQAGFASSEAGGGTGVG